MALANSLVGSPGASMRNLERIYEDAQLKGILQLNSRKLKEYPTLGCNFDLSDVVKADLSKNRLSEVPEEICSCKLLEDLDCYNNVIRSVPDAIVNLQSLAYLNISRNQLTVIPLALCQLPLEVCNLRNNRIVSIPEEVSSMKCLKDLDVSCNEITIVPPQLGSVTTLQRLNLKRNLLLEIPLELCQLRLTFLDISANRISAIPAQLRFMTSLCDLSLDQNPMTFPPAVLCKRGRMHVFKFLEIQAIKEDKRGIVLETEFQKFRSPSILSDSRLQNGFSIGSCRKSYTFDSGYSTSDGDCRSQESGDLACGFKKFSAESPRWDSAGHLYIRNQNTNTLFSYLPTNGEDGKDDDALGIQTFKEYKEALRKKREAEAVNVYKRTPPDENGGQLSPKLPVSKTKSVVAAKQTLRKNDSSSSISEDGSKGPSSPLVNQWQNESADYVDTPIDYTPKMPHSPSTGNGKLPSNDKKILNLEQRSSSPQRRDPPFAWPPKNAAAIKSSKLSFTMRREFDKAREEQELILKLREILESRLKLKLPDEMESALNDGVFLCHLANNIRNNSVTCIHVPSPAVPKLTIAKCRRNADNFLGACRHLGVPNAELRAWAELYLNSGNPQTKEMPLLAEPSSPVLFSCFLISILIATAMFLHQFPSFD